MILLQEQQENWIIITSVIFSLEKLRLGELFKSFNNACINSKLIIIGDGEEKNNLESIIKDYNLSNFVFLLGNKNDANRYYNIMDVFLLTSYNEGLPFVLIEAQANGLSCVVSDCVSKDAKINDNITFLSLEDNFNKWIASINKYSKIREKNVDKIINKYSLTSMHKKIINDIYEG